MAGDVVVNVRIVELGGIANQIVAGRLQQRLQAKDGSGIRDPEAHMG
jgi:hypothetical protein